MPRSSTRAARFTAREPPSCSPALAHHRLHVSGLPIPDVMVTADDVVRGKPDPACCLLAAGRLSVAPHRCVVIEDAPIGIAAGLGAGAIVIALRTTHEDRELAAADAIVDDRAALLGLG